MEAFIYVIKQLYIRSINPYVKDGRDCTKIITPYLKDGTDCTKKYKLKNYNIQLLLKQCVTRKHTKGLCSNSFILLL